MRHSSRVASLQPLLFAQIIFFYVHCTWAGVVINEDFTDGEFSNSAWSVVTPHAGFATPSISREGIPESLTHTLNHTDTVWPVAVLNVPEFGPSQDEVIFIRFTSFSDVANSSQRYYFAEVACLHLDPSHPFGHDHALETSHGYQSAGGASGAWQFTPSVENSEADVPNTHYQGNPNATRLTQAQTSLTIFRPSSGEAATNVEISGANLPEGAERTISQSIHTYDNIQISMPRALRSSGNTLATGATAASAQIGMTAAHVGITHKADANLDYSIDAQDFMIWNLWRGKPGGNQMQRGDFDNDGDADTADLAIWLAAKGTIFDEFSQSSAWSNFSTSPTTAFQAVLNQPGGRLEIRPTIGQSPVIAYRVVGPQPLYYFHVPGGGWSANVRGSPQWVDDSLTGLQETTVVSGYANSVIPSDFSGIEYTLADGTTGRQPIILEQSPPIADFQSWLNSHNLVGSDRSPATDITGAGAGNLLRYWLGWTPTEPPGDRLPAPLLQMQEGMPVMKIIVQRTAGASAADVMAEFSPNLVDWHHADPPSVEFIAPNTEKWTFNIDTASTDRSFARLSVHQRVSP